MTTATTDSHHRSQLTPVDRCELIQPGSSLSGSAIELNVDEALAEFLAALTRHRAGVLADRYAVYREAYHRALELIQAAEPLIPFLDALLRSHPTASAPVHAAIDDATNRRPPREGPDSAWLPTGGPTMEDDQIDQGDSLT